MTIESGNAASADDVMNAFGRTLKIYSNLVWNSDLIGFDSNLSIDLENYTYDTLQGVSKLDETNGDIAFLSAKDEVWSSIGMPDNYTQVDADSGDAQSSSSTAKDEVILTNFWTGGSTGTASIQETNDTIDFRNANANSSITLKLASVTTSSPSTETFEIILWDGSTEVTIYTNTSTTAQTPGLFRFDINPGTDTVTRYNNSDINSEASGTGVDISSLNNSVQWKLRFKLVGTANDNLDTYTWRIRPLRYLLSNAGTADIISDAVTSSATITNAILVLSESSTGSATYFLSADNGANYESVTPNQIHRFSNTGTQLKVKVTMTTDVTDFYLLNHYAVQYNYY